jgi:hypothetical protein
MEEGSKEAYSAILRNQGGNAGQSVQEQIKGILQAQTEIQRRQAEYGKEVADAMKSLGIRTL